MTTETKELTKADAVNVAPTDLDMAKALVASGFFPNVRTASQALVKVQLGRELGFGPVASMMGVHVWTTGSGDNSRTVVQLSANMIAALVRRSGRYDFRVIEHSEIVCRIKFFQDKQEIGESLFTTDHAKAAGLMEKTVWKHWPKNMLFAAAMRNGARWFCSEVLLGGGVPLDTASGDDMAAAIEEGEVLVDEDGVIIEGEAREVPVVTGPPEGFEPNWAEFWANARELNMGKPEVHAIFAVPETDGALKEYAAVRAERQGKPLAQVVAEMLTDLKAAKEGKLPK